MDVGLAPCSPIPSSNPPQPPSIRIDPVPTAPEGEGLKGGGDDGGGASPPPSFRPHVAAACCSPTG